MKKYFCEDPRHPCRYLYGTIGSFGSTPVSATAPKSTTPITNLYNQFPDQGLRDAMKKKYGSSPSPQNPRERRSPEQEPTNQFQTSQWEQKVYGTGAPYYHPSNYNRPQAKPQMSSYDDTGLRRRHLFEHTDIYGNTMKKMPKDYTAGKGVYHHGKGVHTFLSVKSNEQRTGTPQTQTEQPV